MGNLSALDHNVHHHEECKHTFDVVREAEQQRLEQHRLQIAIMIRSDVFRECRARTINSRPGPVEFFNVVNYTVARHLADAAVALPDLTEVLAEVERTDLAKSARAARGQSD